MINTIGKNDTAAEEAALKALSILPAVIKNCVLNAVRASGVPLETLTDIRLRRDGISCFTANGRSYPIGEQFDTKSFDDLVFHLTSGSLYAHAETIREGYISVGGIRCGVCGNAALKNGGVGEISDISSVSVRVARDIIGCSRPVYDLITSNGSLSGALIYSPPGIGKTTLLRDLIRTLSDAGCQTAVIDSRRELASAARGASADLLLGYPKDHGIMSAVRSLSPDIIICDELSGGKDADAALYSHTCGVPIVATAHAGTLEELRSRRELSSLVRAGVFAHIVGLRRRGNEKMSFIINEP